MWSVRHSHPALATIETQVPAVAASSLATAERALPLFERRLAESSYIAAERLTIADIVTFVAIDFARMIRFRPDAKLVHLNHWLDGMRVRPAAMAGT
jgi:glutathione S-transferase